MQFQKNKFDILYLTSFHSQIQNCISSPVLVKQVKFTIGKSQQIETGVKCLVFDSILQIVILLLSNFSHIDFFNKYSR